MFTFNKELVSDSGLMNKWDSTQYIKFEPKIPGKFMWTGKSELTFSPLGQLLPASNYKAILTEELGKYNSVKQSIDNEPILFHTPLLAISSINSFWALSEELGNQVEVHCQLTFNNPVSPNTLKPLLKLLVLGKEMPFHIITQNDAETIEVAFAFNPQTTDNEIKGEIIVNKGLVCTGGNLATENQLKSEFLIPSKDKLIITDTETGFDNGKGYIAIYTSQPIVAEGLASFVATDPEMNIETEVLSNGFKVKGDFLGSQTYILNIKKGMKSMFGRYLEEDYTKTVSFADPLPAISFTEQNAIYLSTKGERNLGVNITNVAKVKVSVFKIFENNIQHYLRQGKSWEYNYNEATEEYNDYNTWSFDENYGKPVMTKEILTRSLQKSGNISLLNLDLNELNFNDSYKGLYLVKVEASDRKFIQDAQLLSLSDLGLIVKEGATDVMVFVNSLKDATPVKGAKLDFISSNSQKVYSTVTDNNGVAIFKNVKQVAAGFKLSMVSVRYENDFNFVLFDKTRVETSRFDVGGKRTDNANYDVFIYGDRDLYRPGDTAHINTILRTTRWDVVKDIPIKIKLLAPNGREYLNQRHQLNASGAAETKFFIPKQAMTGSYLIEAYAANDVLLASRKISVEEFVPDRIKVTSKTSKDVYLPAEPINLDLLAENLYGTPAAGRRFETELRLKRKQLMSKALPEYSFALESKNMPVLASIVMQGNTNADGKASSVFQSVAYKDIGLLEGKIFTTVFDETGRPVNRLNVVEIPTQQVYFGIKGFDSWLSTRKALNLQFAAVDRTGKGLPGAQARVVIMYYRYETVIEKSYGRYNYVSQKKEKVVLEREIKVSGSGTALPFMPLESGEYEVRIMAPGSENYVSKYFYAYGWGDTNFSSFEVSREGEVTITSDKAIYSPGNKAKILFKAPFDGKLLVAIEQDNVLSYKFLNLENKSASMEIAITKDHLPNIYIDATAFRKSGDMSIPLTVAHGVVSLKVEDVSTKLNIAITAPEKSRSGVKQTFTIKTAPNAELTIAVVDEGILQITDYKTPDPFNWFYQKRALGVNSYDVYALLYPELKHSSSPAGGEAFDLSRRINPLTGDRVKLISKWSGIRKANSSGECSFSIDIPQFSGALRIMAVAYKGKQFGSAEKTMKVADPVIVSMSLPRFLSPGDNCVVAVSLTNTTAKKGDATIQLTASGPVSVSGKNLTSVSLNPENEEVALFNVISDKGIGVATLTATVSSLGQKFSQLIEVPVRPAGGLTFITESGSVVGAASKTIRMTSDLYPTSVKSALVLSKSPAVEFAKNLDYLVRYPYGCLEQTVSCAFPQLYLSDITKLFPAVPGRNFYEGGSPGDNVQQAILKIESMQLYNGGLSLWPQGGSPDWWATAYAAHFLIESKEAGFEVNAKVLDGILKFLTQKVKEREMETYFYFENEVRKSRNIPRREILYSVYALALADMAPVSAMNYYKSISSELSSEGRYMLASAFLRAGDVKSFRSILPKAFGNEKAINEFGGSYSSCLRDKSIALNALLETDPNNPQVNELLKSVSLEMKNNKYFSTQEASFALLAIGKHARKALTSDITAQISIDGKEVGRYNNKDIQLPLAINNKSITISAKGKGALYYYFEMSGIKLTPNTEDQDNHLKVRRRFLDRNGNQISGNSFTQNDLVVVEITAQSESGSTIENVAITDLLPACFEIENSRLVAEREMGFMKNRSTPEFTDIRDDRISFFTSLNGNAKTFYYTVRAVSKGTFVIGAVSADAMYNGEYHSYSGSGKVVVK
ncbi:MAG: alpha-2-macroglobulin family protein [Bacteroidales bacterium]